MILRWFAVLLFLTGLSSITSLKSCPQECRCSTDKDRRFQAFCTNGGMTEIPIGYFDNTTEIIHIQGPGNQLSIGPIFTGLQQLVVLRIVDSNVPAIGHNSFWYMPNMKILDLSQNNITAAVDYNFRGIENLIELDLSKNKIDRMPSATFRFLRALKTLSLADNSITELVPRIFLQLSNLKNLDLSGNPVQVLPPEVFKDVQKLKQLKCRNCQLKYIRPQLYGYLNNLVDLNLGDNEIDFGDFNQLKHLKYLRVDGNSLHFLETKALDNLGALELLDVSRNRLTNLDPFLFTSLQNLTFLDLSYNDLKGLGPVLDSLYNLTSFNVSGNYLIETFEINHVFEVHQGLNSLSLADMKYSENNIQEIFLDSLSQLRSLNLSGNDLREFSLVLNLSGSLQHLDLSRNQISKIEDDITASRLQKIRDVKLDGNPLICDRCHMGPILQRVRDLKWKTFPICHRPEEINGRRINYLRDEEILSCYGYSSDASYDPTADSRNFFQKSHINILAIIGGVIFILLAIFIVMSAMCYSRQRARYYTHEDKINNENNTEKGTSDTNAIVNNEINFKFPLDERTCMIDESFIPATTMTIK